MSSQRGEDLAVSLGVFRRPARTILSSRNFARRWMAATNMQLAIAIPEARQLASSQEFIERGAQ